MILLAPILLMSSFLCADVNQLFSQGIEKIRGRAPQEAIHYFEEALIERPNAKQILYWLGHAYGDLGNTDEAQKAFEKVVALDDSNYNNVRGKLWVIYLKNRDWEKQKGRAVI